MNLVLDVSCSSPRTQRSGWSIRNESERSIGVGEDDFTHRGDGFEPCPGREEGGTGVRERDDFRVAELIGLGAVELDLWWRERGGEGKKRERERVVERGR